MSNKEKILTKICNDVIESYRNPQNPNFNFILERTSNGMYDGFLKDLETLYIIHDLSDLNYSSCLTCSIINKVDKKIKYGIKLSLVGKYAILKKYKTKQPITEISYNIDDTDSLLISLFNKHKILLLEDIILNSKIPIKIKDEDFTEQTNSCVYNLLFERL